MAIDVGDGGIDGDSRGATGTAPGSDTGDAPRASGGVERLAGVAARLARRRARIERRAVQGGLARLGGLALALAAALALSGDLRGRAGEWLAASAGPAGVEVVGVREVVDGDTLVVADGRSIRILGIDTPETHNPNMAGPQPLGEAATARLAALVAGRDVGLQADAADADDYGRALRHVWVGRTLVAEQLLSEGLGHALIIPPSHLHADRLRAAEADAKAHARGLWGLPRPTALPIFGGAGVAPAGAMGAAGRAVAPRPAASATVGVMGLAGLAAAGAGGLASEGIGTGAAVSGTVRAGGATRPCDERVPGAVSAAAAKDLVDTFQAVAFDVVRTKDTGRVTFLNSHDPYQGHFYVAIFPTDYDKYPAPPAIHFRGRCIVVQGTIELYRGAPQMVLRGPEDVRIVDDDGGAPIDVGGVSP